MNRKPQRLKIGSAKIYINRRTLIPVVDIQYPEWIKFYKKVGKKFYPISLKIESHVFDYILSDILEVSQRRRNVKKELEVVKYVCHLTQMDIDLIKINVVLGGRNGKDFS
jgi:hypothetical protein